MEFSDLLKDIVARVAGGKAAFLAEADGILLAEHSLDPETDVAGLSAELSAVMRGMGGRNESLVLGEVAECVIATGRHAMVARWINPDYFACVILAPHGCTGKARYLLTKHVPDLLAEL